MLSFIPKSLYLQRRISREENDKRSLSKCRISQSATIASDGGGNLESNADNFKSFAYGTHAPAYKEAGVQYLSIPNLFQIATTPDFSDIFTPDGLFQVGSVGWACFVEKVKELDRGGNSCDSFGH